MARAGFTPSLRGASNGARTLLATLLVLSAAFACGDDGTDPTAEVATVEITADDFRLLVGSSTVLDAEVRNGAGDAVQDAGLTWTSSNESVATVDAQGRVEAVGGGTASVSAEADGVSDAVQVTVPQPVGTAGSEGGVISDDDTGVIVELPAGAVSSSVSISVAPALSDSLPSASEDEAVLEGAAFEFGPSGTQFSAPVSLTIPFDPAELPADHPERRLTVAVAEGDSWVPVETTVDPEADRVSAEVDHFSVWAVIARRNRPPRSTIEAPANGASFPSGTPVTFRGSGTDAEDGPLTGSALVWESSIDGELGTGEEVTRSDLAIGNHRITLTATDLDGATWESRIDIEITDQAPTATIEEPSTGAFFQSGATVTLVGSAEDPEDGALSGSALRWTSDLDGALGSGAEVEVILSDGQHVITLTAIDGSGISGTATTRVVAGGASLVRVTPNPDPEADVHEVADPATGVVRTLPGGTLTIADGSYLVEEVLVDRPMTIEGEGTAAEIRNETARYSFRVDGIESGGVVFRNLKFVVTSPQQDEPFRQTWAVITAADEAAAAPARVPAQGGTFDALTIEGSTFDLAPEASAGVGIARVVEAGATVRIEDNEFSGGKSQISEFVGEEFRVFPEDVPPQVLVARNTFGGSADRAVIFASGWEITENTFLDCGLDCVWANPIPAEEVDIRVAENRFERCNRICIFNLQAGGTREIVDNVFDLPQGIGDFSTIWIQTGEVEAGTLDVTVRNNEMMNCGPRGCISLFQTEERDDIVGVIEQNTLSPGDGFELDPLVQAPIVLTRVSAGVTIRNNTIERCGFDEGACIHLFAGSSASILDNDIDVGQSDLGIVIQGFSSEGEPRNTTLIEDNVITAAAGISDPGDPDAYAANAGFWANHTDMTLNRNTLENAHLGIHASNDGQVTGSDNVVRRTLYAVDVFSGSRGVDLHENDFTEYVHAFDAEPAVGALTCNWWGQASGPTGFPAEVDSEVYTPWATGPIANDGGGACDGGQEAPAPARASSAIRLPDGTTERMSEAVRRVRELATPVPPALAGGGGAGGDR